MYDYAHLLPVTLYDVSPPVYVKKKNFLSSNNNITKKSKLET